MTRRNRAKVLAVVDDSYPQKSQNFFSEVAVVIITSPIRIHDKKLGEVAYLLNGWKMIISLPHTMVIYIVRLSLISLIWKKIGENENVKNKNIE